MKRRKTAKKTRKIFENQIAIKSIILNDIHCSLAKVNFFPVVFMDFGNWEIITKLLHI